MKFTVFGSTGFIGRHLTAYLRGLGHQVLTPGRGELASLQGHLGHAIYAIGLTADFRTKPFETVRAHVTVLSDLLENAPFDSLTYLSSTRLYSGAACGRWDAAISVNSTDASDLYNLSKLMGESLCLNAGRKGTKVVRLSNVVGAGDPHSSNFLYSLIQEARNGRISLQSDPQSDKDYIHLDDVVEMLPRIATEGRLSTYNLASGLNLTHAAWVNALHALTGCEIHYPQGKSPVTFPPIDISALQSEFHFTPRPVLPILPNLLA
jgi:nucleoside-diphosphate-sugar epimerase